MSDYHEDDDLPPERVTLFSVIDNKEGANLIKSIYFFLGGYCALMVIGVIALFYFTGRINGIFAVVVAFWIFNRLDQYKLGRRSDIKFEIIFFTGFPVASFLILTYATLGSGGPAVDTFLISIFSPFFLLSCWGFRILRKIKNNDNLVRELKSREDLYRQYREWLYAEK